MGLRHLWRAGLHRCPHDAALKAAASPNRSVSSVVTAEQNGWYEFNISTDGTYNVLLVNGWHKVLRLTPPIVNDSTEYLKRGKRNMNLVSCVSKTLWLYINRNSSAK